ncbi:hypothetical protein J4050_13035 [Winogradskyella sp. DF17]|uniref:Lipoprotein n=1 Tax=Winogradskyella pelagia TaxID=2819984 RepID=A0ABS3T4I9_9FLAO|nr:hypothetical protein [Winogradskyella sp. DF17]MBO3117674.1 hypothetical protein [Winogradskyella sp. DF17]
MKDKIITLFLLMLITASCDEKTFQFDDIIQECYETKYQAEGYDIKSIIDNHEKLLIEQGVLKDGSGESYLEVFKKIAMDKDFYIESPAFQDYDPKYKVNKETLVALFECERKMIELAKEKDFKWNKLFNTFESPEVKENPSEVYEVMVKNLTDNDLNSYYFKLKMFTLFDMVNSKWVSGQ